MKKIGYLIPEFPGQTHIWMWRELSHMREWGVPITIFSTRRPSPEVRARHAFAEAAESETVYLWPTSALRILSSFFWAIFLHPLGTLRAIECGLTLPVDKRPALKTVLPLVFPACLLAKQCSRIGITHLHSHTCSNSAVLGMMVKRILGIPFSMTLNANIEWWGGAMKEKFSDAEFTVAITQWLLDQMHRDFPMLRSDQSLLGRIGVDTRQWIPSGFSESPDGTIRLITVGRLHPSKGHDILLRSVKMLVDRRKRVSLRLAGSGGEQSSLEQLAEELGISDNVKFLGSLSEERVVAELQSSDIFALASHAEPLGVVYMEAMALGIPTIGTRAGGVGEIITDGVDGVLVPPNDAEALAEAIESLMADPQRRMTIGRAGRETIASNFDSRIGAATLYKRLFGTSPELVLGKFTPCELTPMIEPELG